ncbi:MAG TPA: RNA polymerase sigma factor [Dermatophilaceae bacterium]|nr:RNA polymerase sigma factor [Dermatophilaceae bacterium]
MREPFERVVGQHGPTVLRVCRAVLGPTDAEDAWAETFLAALQAYPDLPPEANLEAWLVTIAHRKAIDVTRRAARRPIPVSDPDRHIGGPGRDAGAHSPTYSNASSGGHARDPSDAAAAAVDLYAALARLPPKQRHAIAYHHLAGLPHAQVAEVIGGSVQASRRAVADGIATLRRRLTDPQEEEDHDRRHRRR